MLGELLSSSQPPVEFFNPFNILIGGVLYGGGALLIREYTLRWGKGWYARAWLGAAYGIWEEGFLVGSWFNPQWPDIKDYGTYGWFLHTNWVWAAGLTLYHGTVSTLVPILLVELMFPEKRSVPWLSDRALKWITGAFAAEGLIGAFGFWLGFHRSYPVLLNFLTLIPIAYLVKRAQRAPAGGAAVPETSRPVPAPWKFALAGFAAIFAMFFYSGVMSKGPNPAPFVAPMLLLALTAMLLARWMERASGYGRGWADRHRLAAAIGPLAFFILLAPVFEFKMPRTDNPAGQTLVGIACLVFLLWLRSRVLRREAPATPPPAPHLPAS